MKIYLLCSASDLPNAARTGARLGILSYIADGSRLRAEKLPPELRGGMMAISATDSDEYIAAGIYDECRRRGYREVFLDCEKPNAALPAVCESLARRGLSVFCPMDFAEGCRAATPVAEACVSGGMFSEYLEFLLRPSGELALFIPRTFQLFDMPSRRKCGRDITMREMRSLLYHSDATVFYSPQLMMNYFVYPQGGSGAAFVLFDDARSINEKLRLAKKLGIKTVFLAYRSISDIVSDIMF